MSPDYYGRTTLARPMVANVPTPPPGQSGWVLVVCAWCGGGCWKRPIEPDPLPPGVAVACTQCALDRGRDQAGHDLARFVREQGGADHA